MSCKRALSFTSASPLFGHSETARRSASAAAVVLTRLSQSRRHMRVRLAIARDQAQSRDASIRPPARLFPKIKRAVPGADPCPESSGFTRRGAIECLHRLATPRPHAISPPPDSSTRRQNPAVIAPPPRTPPPATFRCFNSIRALPRLNHAWNKSARRSIAFCSAAAASSSFPVARSAAPRFTQASGMSCLSSSALR